MASNHKKSNVPSSKTKPSKTVSISKKPEKSSSTPAKSKFSQKQIALFCGIVAILVAAIAIVLIFALNRTSPQDETPDNPEVIDAPRVVDYDQKVTDENGKAFQAEYQSGSDENFSIRFADLKCADGCKNVDEVKLGDKILRPGEDYEAKSGSIIIILTADFMKTLKSADYDLVIAVVDEGETSLYGVKFTVKPEPTCKDDETLEKGVCVKKPATPETSNSTSSTTPQPSQSATQPSQPSQPSQPAQPATPSQPSAEQLACERRAGPVSVITISYLTADQKQNWINDMGASPDIVALVMSNSIEGNTRMIWKNNQCQVYLNGAMIYGSVNQPFSMTQLPAKAQAYPNRNAVIWQWADGSEQIELVSEPYGFVINHE